MKEKKIRIELNEFEADLLYRVLTFSRTQLDICRSKNQISDDYYRKLCRIITKLEEKLGKWFDKLMKDGELWV